MLQLRIGAPVACYEIRQPDDYRGASQARCVQREALLLNRIFQKKSGPEVAIEEGLGEDGFCSRFQNACQFVEERRVVLKVMKDC